MTPERMIEDKHEDLVSMTAEPCPPGPGVFQPLRIPLRGLHLIEASAGTGKTYSLALLYLRLLLERALAVDQILVVTFTKAATEELRERIRQRVQHALNGLRQPDLEADPLLLELLARQPDPEAARALLEEALVRLDEAAVHTIHGFCQRMLQEHAFESGQVMDAERLSDETSLREQTAADFWRCRLEGLALDEAGWLRQHIGGPEALLAHLGPTLARDDLTLLPQLPLDAARDAVAELRLVFHTLREVWREQGAAAEQCLRTDPGLNRLSYKTDVITRAIAALEALLGEDCLPLKLPEALKWLTPGQMAEKTKPGRSPPSHPCFDLCGRLQQDFARVQAGYLIAQLSAARAYIRAELARRKEERRQMAFEDLLRRLAAALESPGGEALAKAIRGRYPVAFVDEFQDTDPLQYRIFRRLYLDQPESGLFLIGDPKQAIYAFRGADIFAYMEASRDAARLGRSLSLDTNWRSASRLVHGVNTLFQRARAPFVLEPEIRFLPVRPGPKADEEPLLIDGERPIPLQWWWLPLRPEIATLKGDRIRVEPAREASARACAERIVTYLGLAEAGRCTLGGKKLEPGQIAVLVRTHEEGETMRAALRRCGVGSITLSRNSVFTTAEAEELGQVLRAVVDPGDEGLVRTALAGSLLGVSARELDRLLQDEVAWGERLDRLQRYRQLWLHQGFMLAFQSMLHEEGLPARLLAGMDGERRLTNLLQLGELLQLASTEHPGLDALLRWLSDQIREEEGQDENRQLRLESDQALVQIITWHSSKGLEYPLVFIPFPWSYRTLEREKVVVFHDRDGRGVCADLGSAEIEPHRQLARTESLAERLRLFYVAITRAKQLCILCWGPINGTEDSAPAYLLHPDPEAQPPASRMKNLEAEAMRRDLEALVAAAPEAISLQDLPAPSGHYWRPPRPPASALRVAPFRGRIEASWRLVSYSSLAKQLDPEPPDYDGVAAGETRIAPRPEPVVEAPFRFPKGAAIGQMLHELLAGLDFPQATEAVLQEAMQRQLGRYGRLGAARGGDPAANLTAMGVELITNVLDTPLEAQGLRLRDIPLGDRRNELEFHFSLTNLELAGLDRALAPFPNYRAIARRLDFPRVQGLMKGYIDLVFRYRGRYFLLDYKSNHLGDRLEDYGQAGMELAIGQHGYDLQYLIYSLALHRYLSLRLAAYDPERQWGGVYYLFLRGMRPEHGPAYGVFFDRPSLGVITSLDQLFQGRSR